jgi:hypothetical protein
VNRLPPNSETQQVVYGPARIGGFVPPYCRDRQL